MLGIIEEKYSLAMLYHGMLRATFLYSSERRSDNEEQPETIDIGCNPHERSYLLPLNRALPDTKKAFMSVGIGYPASFFLAILWFSLF